ncbi:MAG: SHOCT domain-containing protein [Oscillospiraceae bacterium]|nr:SHOCT domain-containing protein [Oscillospiraceae bacterium]
MIMSNRKKELSLKGTIIIIISAIFVVSGIIIVGTGLPPIGFTLACIGVIIFIIGVIFKNAGSDTINIDKFDQNEKGSTADELLKYKELMDKGAITKAEYEKLKNELLGKTNF